MFTGGVFGVESKFKEIKKLLYNIKELTDENICLMKINYNDVSDDNKIKSAILFFSTKDRGSCIKIIKYNSICSDNGDFLEIPEYLNCVWAKRTNAATFFTIVEKESFKLFKDSFTNSEYLDKVIYKNSNDIEVIPTRFGEISYYYADLKKMYIEYESAF